MGSWCAVPRQAAARTNGVRIEMTRFDHISKAGALAIAAALLSGCCPGQSIVLHGNCSLGLSHVDAPCDALTAGGGVCCSGNGGACGRGCGHQATDESPYGPDARYYHPNFHPVPTRPLFGPDPVHGPAPGPEGEMAPEPVPVPQSQVRTRLPARRSGQGGLAEQVAAWHSGNAWEPGTGLFRRAPNGMSHSRVPRYRTPSTGGDWR